GLGDAGEAAPEVEGAAAAAFAGGVLPTDVARPSCGAFAFALLFMTLLSRPAVTARQACYHFFFWSSRGC
ncbi:hypothetical protein ACH55_22975, partial [Salmonella enterica subsp. enterica serovar Typhimurium]